MSSTQSSPMMRTLSWTVHAATTVFVFESIDCMATYRLASSQQRKKSGCSARTTRGYPRPG